MNNMILKEKGKKLSVKEAVKLLQPFAKNWKRIDEETARKFHDVYMETEFGLWKYVLEGLNISNTTWYRWLKKYNLDVKQPHPDGSHKITKMGILDDEDEELELEPAEVEDNLETEYDTHKYQETFTILNNAERLSKNMFQVVEKDELIKKLQNTIKHLTTLLIKLESNIEE